MPINFERRPENPASYRRGRAIVEFELDLLVEWENIVLRFWERRGRLPESRSRYTATIRPSNFEELAKAMMSADHEAAIKAFGAALAEGIPSAPNTAAH